MKLSLDSNILVYAAHNDDDRHELAVGVVKRAARSDCVQSLQSFGECFSVLTRKRLLAPEAAMGAVARFRAIFPVVAADVPALEAAMRMTDVHKLQFWDAFLLATVRNAGCRVLLSEDMSDGQEIDGIKILNPLKPKDKALVDLVLPPLESDP